MQDFHLADWLVQPALCRLSRDGRTVPVRARVMDLLVYLAGRPGEVISKTTLLDDVWGTRDVSESALTRTVTELRQALGDELGSPEFIETIPKRGYRLIAPVRLADGPTQSMSASARPRGALWRPRRALAASIIAALVVGVVLERTQVLPAARAAVRRVLWGAGDASAASTPRFRPRDWVLVAAFENRTGEAEFDDILEQALERELIGSGFVSVVPRPRLEDTLALMKRPPDARLDIRLAREVCLRDGGIRALLTGRFDRIGGVYVLTTRIVTPEDGSIVATLSDDVGDPAGLLRRVRAHALEVRRALGDTLPALRESAVFLEKVTTPSLPALQFYSRAAALLSGDSWQLVADASNRYSSAEALLREAVAADPSFASAWLLLANTSMQQERSAGEYLPYAERALSLASHVTPVERYFIEGVTHLYRSVGSEKGHENLEAAASAFEALLQIAPDHYWALQELLIVYSQLGRQDEIDRVTLQAAAVRPHSIRFAVDSARIHLRRRDADAAREAVHRIVSAGALDGLSDGVPEESLGWIRLWEAHESWLRGDVRRALDAARGAERRWTDPHRVWSIQLAHLYEGLGRFDDAARVADRMQEREWREWLLALIAARRERWAELGDILAMDRKDFALQNRLPLLAWAGWVDRAEWILAERRRRNITVPWHIRADHEGQLRVAQGRYREGLALLESLRDVRTGPRYRVDEHIAIAQHRLGAAADAIQGLERATSGREGAVASRGWAVYDWLRCRLLLAELYGELGHSVQARDVAQEVRGLLSVADSDHPWLARLDTLDAALHPSTR